MVFSHMGSNAPAPVEKAPKLAPAPESATVAPEPVAPAEAFANCSAAKAAGGGPVLLRVPGLRAETGP